MAIDIGISYNMGGVLAGIVSGVLLVGVGDLLPVLLSGLGAWRVLWASWAVWWAVVVIGSGRPLWALWRAVGLTCCRGWIVAGRRVLGAIVDRGGR